ncbi:MAG: ATP-binding protein [bacterium]|nr:ATP-binding protein [bacterium]
MSVQNESQELQKGASPFNPTQPVPVELFVGRSLEIDRIMHRGAGQVATGKPVAIFVQGEYGIGKSSVAKFTQYYAERDYSLWPIYASLAECSDLTSMAEAILKAALRTHAFDKALSGIIKEFLADYVENISLFGQITIKTDALKRDAPNLASAADLIDFLRSLYERLKLTGCKGIFLVLDEINGIADNPKFAHFLKGFIDTNAVSKKPVPLLLMLCGVEERRRKMIRNHEPVERIFDIISINTLSPEEMADFFTRAFDSVNMTVDPKAMDYLTLYSAGFPKIMHLLGDEAFWLDKDGKLDEEDTLRAVVLAADEVGRRFVNEQVFNSLKSKDYHSILAKVAKEMGPGSTSFIKSDVMSSLTESEKKKFNNFLQRMKKLKVLRSGERKGEYIFNMRMVQVYIWFQAGKTEHP